MQNEGNGVWSVDLEFTEQKIEYYIYAIANNGKEQYRPMTALEGGFNTFLYNVNQCDNTALIDQFNSENKLLVRIIDIIGREVDVLEKGKVLFLIFDDGSIEKKIIN